MHIQPCILFAFINCSGGQSKHRQDDSMMDSENSLKSNVFWKDIDLDIIYCNLENNISLL